MLLEIETRTRKPSIIFLFAFTIWLEYSEQIELETT